MQVSLTAPDPNIKGCFQTQNLFNENLCILDFDLFIHAR